MTRAKKTRVKSTARAEKMAARWKDPVYAAKMRDAAKRGAAAANAKRKTASPPPHETPTGAATEPARTAPAGAPPPDPKAKAPSVKSYTGRGWG